MDRRKIVILDAGGCVIKELDVSEIDNASAAAVMQLEVRTRCEMGDWHAGQRVVLSPWGNRVKEPKYRT